MDKQQSGDLHRYIRPTWKRHSLQTYAFISRLINDKTFRKEWIKRRVQKDYVKNQKAGEQLLKEFSNQLELTPAQNTYGKPVIRISPRRFKGHRCQNLLNVNLKHITTCVSLIIDEAAESIIKGYGIVNVLGSVFGEEYRRMVTQYVIRKMQEEIGQQDGRR